MYSENIRFVYHNRWSIWRGISVFLNLNNSSVTQIKVHNEYTNVYDKFHYGSNFYKCLYIDKVLIQHSGFNFKCILLFAKLNIQLINMLRQDGKEEACWCIHLPIDAAAACLWWGREQQRVALRAASGGENIGCCRRTLDGTQRNATVCNQNPIPTALLKHSECLKLKGFTVF